jgi:3-methyladenine DNA glycosylase AlkC
MNDLDVSMQKYLHDWDKRSTVRSAMRTRLTEDSVKNFSYLIK